MKRKYRNGKDKNGNKKIKWLNFTLTHLNWHHAYPTSRKLKGTKEFKIYKNIVEHIVWHKVFSNFFPEEVIEKIRQSTNAKEEVNVGLITDQIERWWILFGNHTSASDVITIIKEKWTYPGVEFVRNFNGYWVMKEN